MDSLSTNQERLLYLLNLYSDDFLSTPHISVLVFEGCKEPGDDDDGEISVSIRSDDADKYAFTYNFFQSFGDVEPGVQVQLYSSMVMKNDLRHFKKLELVEEEKLEVDTGTEHCYRITEKGKQLLSHNLSERSKASVHSIVFAPNSTNLLTVFVRNKSFYITTPATDGDDNYEKKSAITRPQESVDEGGDGFSSEDEDEKEKEKRRQTFKITTVQRRLSERHTEPDQPKSKACTIQ